MCAASDADASSRSSARLRRLCLTGVSADRGARGRLALQSWRQSLRAGDLAGFVWRLMLDTYSPATLAAQEGRRLDTLWMQRGHFSGSCLFT